MWTLKAQQKTLDFCFEMTVVGFRWWLKIFESLKSFSEKINRVEMFLLDVYSFENNCLPQKEIKKKK